MGLKVIHTVAVIYPFNQNLLNYYYVHIETEKKGKDFKNSIYWVVLGQVLGLKFYIYYPNPYDNSFCKRKVKNKEAICLKITELLSGLELPVSLNQKHMVFSLTISCFPHMRRDPKNLELPSGEQTPHSSGFPC